MVAALRKLGFKKVYDTVYSADLTIMEEGTELLNRISNGGVLPQFTSCCPGGCVNGGGQPIDFNAYEKIERRTEGLYKADKDLPRRKSQDNPSIIETYKKVLPEGPCGEKAHHLLHTKYAKRGNFRDKR